MSDVVFVVDRKPMETRIPMEYRTDDQARRITLCKRKKGLCKKAEELAQLCGIQVAVCIVGDGCKPAQMVATGSGAYHDIASCHKVMTEYSAQIKAQEIDNPTAALDSQKTLVEQRQQLERQRREIVKLSRQLADARGGSFHPRPPPKRNHVPPKRDHVKPRKRGRSTKKLAPPAVVSFSCFSQTLPPSVSDMTYQDSMMLTHPTHDPCWLSMSEPIGVESSVVESPDVHDQTTTHEGALCTNGRGSEANECRSAGAEDPTGFNLDETDTDDVFEAIAGSFEHCLSN